MKRILWLLVWIAASIPVAVLVVQFALKVNNTRFDWNIVEPEHCRAGTLAGRTT